MTCDEGRFSRGKVMSRVLRIGKLCCYKGLFCRFVINRICISIINKVYSIALLINSDVNSRKVQLEDYQKRSYSFLKGPATHS